MSAFSAAIDAIFVDPNMAADATWSDQGITAPAACRVIRKSPDELADYGAARIMTETTIVDLRVAEIMAPRVGDIMIIGTERFRIQSHPRRDREQLVWTLDLVPA